MICPHCQFETPKFKTNWLGGEKAEPKKGNFSLCLECGGFSIITGPDSLRKAVKQEVDEIKHKPELLLLGRLREYAYNLHSAGTAVDLEQEQAKRKK